jgi:4,5:9,10-diseco-3-hydroxy-5,9,17-trioxoandrosta-1(10),2-diene-4-oate hydrolase
VSITATDLERRPPFGKRLPLPSGYELHYLESGSGFPVVFIHGSGPGASAYSNFKHNAQVLASAGYRVLLPDMIGFGYSSKPAGIDYTLELFCSGLCDFLDALGIERCALIGNSLGGAISIKTAIDRPEQVSKLVLMAPGGIESREAYFAMPGMQRMVSAFVGEVLDRAGLRRILELLVVDPAFVTDELVEERFNVLQTQPKDVLARMRIPDMTADLGKIRCPVLGFWGMDDQLMPVSGYEKVLRACPDSRFVMLARCGHWAMVEHAAEFNRFVLDFLRQ